MSIVFPSEYDTGRRTRGFRAVCRIIKNNRYRQKSRFEFCRRKFVTKRDRQYDNYRRANFNRIDNNDYVFP